MLRRLSVRPVLNPRAVWLTWLLTLAGTAATWASDTQDVARRLIHESGVRGGFVVHVGCGEGDLTEALRLDSR